MKKLLISIFIAMFTFIVKAQVTFDIPNNSWSHIFTTDCNKGIMFSNIKEWIAKNYENYKDVIQYEDESNCKIIIKGKNQINTSGIESISTNEILYLQYTLTIECKDNKYRFLMENLEIETLIVSIFGDGIDPLYHDVSDYCTTDNTPWYNRAKIKQTELERLQNIDESTLKKKQLQEHRSKINKLEKEINSEITGAEQWITRGKEITPRLFLLVSSIEESLYKMVCKNDDDW